MICDTYIWSSPNVCDEVPELGGLGGMPFVVKFVKRFRRPAAYTSVPGGCMICGNHCRIGWVVSTGRPAAARSEPMSPAALLVSSYWSNHSKAKRSRTRQNEENEGDGDIIRSANYVFHTVHNQGGRRHESKEAGRENAGMQGRKERGERREERGKRKEERCGRWEEKDVLILHNA